MRMGDRERFSSRWSVVVHSSGSTPAASARTASYSSRPPALFLGSTVYTIYSGETRSRCSTAFDSSGATPGPSACTALVPLQAACVG